MSASPDASDPVKPSSNDGAYQLAEGIGGDGRKQGHKCCGVCCDMRRAVIIVNIIMSLDLGLFSVLWALNLTNQAVFTSALAEEFNYYSIGGFGIAAILTIRVLFCLAGIVGAVKYSAIGVGLALAGYAFAFVMSLIGGVNLIGMIMAVFFAYPHVFFIKEVRSGIMTKENYPTEEFSCCCV